MDNLEIYSFLNRPSSGCLKNTTSVNTEVIEVHKTVTATASAQGGSGGYKYAFYYMRQGASQWTVKGAEYDNTTTATLTPYYTGIYYLKVNAKDSSGTIRSKIFTIHSISAVSQNIGQTPAVMPIDSSELI